MKKDGITETLTCYVLREDKSKLLEAVGMEGTPEQMAELFELQTLLNDKVKNTVGHTSLNFSPEDGERLHHDDALMLQIAHDYMKRMGIENTQYIVTRHTDREHPHCHIVSTVWTMTARPSATGTTFSGMRKYARCLQSNTGCTSPTARIILKRNACDHTTGRSMRFTRH